MLGSSAYCLGYFCSQVPISPISDTALLAASANVDAVATTDTTLRSLFSKYRTDSVIWSVYANGYSPGYEDGC